MIIMLVVSQSTVCIQISEQFELEKQSYTVRIIAWEAGTQEHCLICERLEPYRLFVDVDGGLCSSTVFLRLEKTIWSALPLQKSKWKIILLLAGTEHCESPGPLDSPPVTTGWIRATGTRHDPDVLHTVGPVTLEVQSA